MQYTLLFQLDLLPAPYESNCGTLDFSIIDPQRRYTKGLCMDDCILKEVYDQLGCVGEEFEPRVAKGTLIFVIAFFIQYQI